MAFASVSFRLAAGRRVSAARDVGGRISSSSVEAVSAPEVEPIEKTRYRISPPTDRLTVVWSFNVIDLSGGKPGTSCVWASTIASRIEAMTAVSSAPSRSAPSDGDVEVEGLDAQARVKESMSAQSTRAAFDMTASLEPGFSQKYRPVATAREAFRLWP